MEILKKTGKFLLGVVIGVAIMMFADRYYVKGKRLIADNLPKEPVYGEHQPSASADLSDRPSA